MMNLFRKNKPQPVKSSTPRTSALELLIKENRSRAKKDIDNWRMALRTAERYPNPRRYMLLDVYREIVLDAHLWGQIEQRKAKTLHSRFDINKNGEADEELTSLFNTPWFTNLLNHLLDARFFGHSLVQIDSVHPLQNGLGGIKSITLVPRHHISPDEGLLLKRPRDLYGIEYRNAPEFDGWIIETPEYHNMGLLNYAAPHVLYKRFATGAWSQYAEIFGMPLRVGKTNTSNQAMVRDMENMLANMASAYYAVVDDQEEIDFITSNAGKGEVYDNLIQHCNAEISKIITGSVMGENTSKGSRAKEEVSERIAQHVTDSDKVFIQNIINHQVIPVLIRHGYPLKDAWFQWHEEPDLAQLWKNAHEAMQYYHVDAEWVKNTFGIEVTGEKQKQNPGPSLSLSSDFFE